MFRSGLAVAVVLVAVPSFAQDPAPPAPQPRFEVSFGYLHSERVGASADYLAANSLSGSFDWIPAGTRSLAVVLQGDSAGFGSSSGGLFFEYSVLAGPRLRFRQAGRLSAFAQLLVGPRGLVGNPPNLRVPTGNRPWTEVQVAPGAGVDLVLTRRHAVRLAHLEYRAFFGDEDHDARISVFSGIVWRFGTRGR